MNKFFRTLLAIILFLINQTSVFCLDYDYSSTYAICIELSPQKELSTKEGIIEGERIPLKVLHDVYDGEKLLIKAGELAHARVETVITAGMNGFPAEIILNNFEIPGISSSKIMSEYSKCGQNRCLWVYPLKWALTPLPPTGSLTNLIYGGHAKIKSTDIVKIHYYPNWK